MTCIPKSASSPCFSFFNLYFFSFSISLTVAQTCASCFRSIYTHIQASVVLQIWNSNSFRLVQASCWLSTVFAWCIVHILTYIHTYICLAVVAFFFFYIAFSKNFHFTCSHFLFAWHLCQIKIPLPNGKSMLRMNGK